MADTRARLLHLYPVLRDLPGPELDAALAPGLQPLTVPDGALLFEESAPCLGFPMLLSGGVRVARGSPGGRSLELYRITPGELCVVSTAGLFGQGLLSAHAQALQTTELVLLSATGFARLTQQPAFRSWVFGIFAARLADLMALAEAVAFQRLDQRLAQALLGHGSTLRSTHQALADELGTVREMVSRLLSRFERAGWVALGRERIDVLDSAALRQLASGEPPAV